MRVDDDRIAQLMAEIDPAVTPVNEPLTLEQQTLLHRIKSQPPAALALEPARYSRGTKSLRRVGIVSIVVAAMIVAVLVLLPVLTSSGTAQAFTPPPLEFSGPTPSTSEVLRMVHDKLTTADNAAGPQRAASYTGWYLQVDHRPSQKTRVAISPQVTSLVWSADRSGNLRVIAGMPYWADGDTSSVPASHAPTPGTVISSTTFGPGQFDIPTVKQPGNSEADIIATLSALGMPRHADTFAMIEAIHRLLTLWTMNKEQEASIVSLLLHRSDITVDGRATDRDGREVIGVSADETNGSGLKDTVLISTKTGRIIGIETTRITSHGDIPAGVVVAYTLWKDIK